ncbi:MAG TPA: hypothetical protein VFE37_08410 [Chloroflexota bacterium]|nr:hypothetical protein [Chloroflexota bacterium]
MTTAEGASDEQAMAAAAPRISTAPGDQRGAPEDGGVAAEALPVTAATLAAALGVAVRADGADPPTFHFRQAVRFGEGLSRRGVLDLGARRFRATLWAGDHRCLEHLELDDIRAVRCDPGAGRLIVDGAATRLVLSQQGTLTVVPRDSQQTRRGARRATPQP